MTFGPLPTTPPTLPLPLRACLLFLLQASSAASPPFSALCDRTDGKRQAGYDGARTAALYDSHVLRKDGGYRPVIIIGRSCHKYHFCHDKGFVATNTCLSRHKTSLSCLSRQKMSFIATKVCCFVATKLCLSRRNIFVLTNTCLSRQAYIFVQTKGVFYRDKHVLVTFVATKNYTCGSSRQ